MRAEFTTNRPRRARLLRGNTLASVMSSAALCVGCASQPAVSQDASEPSDATQRLTAWNAEFKRDIIEVADNVYAAIGYGASVFTMIEGDDGVVLVDAGQDPQWSGEALARFREITDKPIKALVYTHGHGDHVNGAAAFVGEEGGVEVWARANFNAETRAFTSSGITANRRRGVRQAGFRLPPEQRINNGVAPAVYPNRSGNAFNPQNLVAPTHTFDGERQVIDVAGVQLELVANPGETSDQLYVWYPDEKVVFAGDNFYKSWPNLYAIRGTPYRDVAAWADAVDALLAVDADHLVAGHTRPISGAGEVREALTAYRDGVRYVFDETIAGINQGLTPDELASSIQLPDELAANPVLTPYYGNPEWAIRSIFTGYLGWFDGNPTNLFRLSPAEEARRFADLAGGEDAVLEAARQALASGDPQWTAQLCDHLLALEYESAEAALLKADALTALAEGQITATARNYYLTVAMELREFAAP